MLLPRQAVPALIVPTLTHGEFKLAEDGARNFTLVVFARPHFDELLAALDFALAKNYPARGEYAGVV